MQEFARGMYKVGRLTGPETVELANGDTSSDCKSLAECGGKSVAKNPKNFARDLKRKMCRESKFSEPYGADITLWDSLNNVQVQDEAYFTLPYEQVDLLVSQSAVGFVTAVPGGSELENTVKDWKARQSVGNDERVAPIGLWGDAATMHTDSSLYVLLFNIMSIAFKFERFPLVAFAKRNTSSVDADALAGVPWIVYSLWSHGLLQ